jgi:hypothetical protein
MAPARTIKTKTSKEKVHRTRGLQKKKKKIPVGATFSASVQIGPEVYQASYATGTVTFCRG